MKPTHEGTLKGCDARIPDGFKDAVKLRETKLYYISAWGTKYKKKSGTPVGQKWPLYYLDISTVRALKEEVM